MLLRGHLQSCHDTLCQGHQISRFIVQCQTSSLQTSDVEQVLRQFNHAQCRLIDVLQRFYLPVSQCRTFPSCCLDEQHLGKPLEDGKWASQFMGGYPDELIFEPLGFLECRHILMNDNGSWFRSLCRV